MATRFYFDSTAVALWSPSPGAEWEHTSQLVRRRLNTVKAGSAMTTLATTVDGADHIADQDNLFLQAICPVPLGSQTIGSQTIKLQVRCFESNAGNNLFVTLKLYLIDRTGAAVGSGTMLAITRDNVEITTSTLTNRQFTTTSSSVTCPANSFLVVELGMGGLPTATGGVQGHDGSMRIGDAAGSDLSEDDTSTTDNNPWLEFANTLTFAPAPVVYQKRHYMWSRR